jgi:septal ring factor EnvC (AmiA/AmiB activator)
MGLQTIYSHLSQIAVKEGDQVKRGDILGNTGATAWPAATICTSGSSCTASSLAIEWWDQHWIDDNVADRFK